MKDHPNMKQKKQWGEENGNNYLNKKLYSVSYG